jgi:TRAP-type transport system small permease protein
MMLRRFDQGLRALACVLLVCLLLTVMWGVVTRALGNPSIYTDEGSRFLMAWLAACGWMLAGRGRAHVRIRFFQNLLPDRLWQAIELVIQLAIVVFGFATAGFGMTVVVRHLSINATSLPVSMAWLYFPIVPAALLMGVQAAADVVWRLKRPIDPLRERPAP